MALTLAASQFCLCNAFDIFITITSNLLLFFTIVLYQYIHVTHEKHTWSFILKTEVRHFAILMRKIFESSRKFKQFFLITSPPLHSL